MMQWARIPAVELPDRWDLLANKVHLVIRCVSHQTSQDGVKRGLWPSPCPQQVVSRDDRMIHSRALGLSQRRTTANNGCPITFRLVTDPTSQRYWSVLVNTDLPCLVLKNLLIFFFLLATVSIQTLLTWDRGNTDHYFKQKPQHWDVLSSQSLME